MMRQNCSHDSHSFSFWKKQVWSDEKVADSTGKGVLKIRLQKWAVYSIFVILTNSLPCPYETNSFKKNHPNFFFLGRWGQGRGNSLISLYAPWNYLEFPPVYSSSLYASKFFPVPRTKINCSGDLANTDSL